MARNKKRANPKMMPLAHIGASIIPRSIFAAAPRIPPPAFPLAPKTTVIHTALLNATFLPRALVTPPRHYNRRGSTTEPTTPAQLVESVDRTLHQIAPEEDEAQPASLEMSHRRTAVVEHSTRKRLEYHFGASTPSDTEGMSPMSSGSESQLAEIYAEIKKQPNIHSKPPIVTEDDVQNKEDSTMKQERAVIAAKSESRKQCLELETENEEHCNEPPTVQPHSDFQVTKVEVDQDDQHHLLEENEVLRSTVYSLHEELGRHNDKYRLPHKDSMNLDASLPLASSLPQRQNEMKDLHDKIKSVIKQNDRLKKASRTSLNQSLSDWEEIQEHAEVVLSENHALTGELARQRERSEDMHQTHVKEVAALSRRLAHVEQERASIQEELRRVSDRYSSLKARHEVMMLSTHEAVSMQQHTDEVVDLKHLLDDVKLKHKGELEHSACQIKALEDERDKLAREKAELVVAKRHLVSDVELLRKSKSRLQQQLDLVQMEQLAACQHLSNLLRAIDRTIAERDTYAHMAHNQQRQNSHIVGKVMKQSLSVERMEEKFQLYKTEAAQKT
ncbi:PREDICTED: centrosomal protein of 89 kDa-like isoform X2 [Priapulus caudatus]|uniref:Centrosomal protein of 89 kDa-like isoform X2 n=1 Tax=Priapulus caudatus TaxID=37621 RepID=A0ABM1F8A6_PRICU|nr:PREDICTED: centrosomal protein of 89 kDa-like isoform X2 [Priapulus caudatus]